MPNQKPFKESILYIYKKSPEDLIMLGFVRAVSCNMQTIAESEAVRMFLSLVNLSEDDLPEETAQRTYRAMKKEFPNICECGTVKSEYVTRVGLCGLIQRNSENFILFGWMMGILHITPTTDILHGIKLFLKSTGISQNELYDRHESYRMMLSEYTKILNIRRI